MSVNSKIHLNHVEMIVCDSCLDGVGDECHTPGCALWMSRVPDIPIRQNATVKRITCDVEECPYYGQNIAQGCGCARG